MPFFPSPHGRAHQPAENPIDGGLKKLHLTIFTGLGEDAAAIGRCTKKKGEGAAFLKLKRCENSQFYEGFLVRGPHQSVHA